MVTGTYVSSGAEVIETLAVKELILGTYSAAIATDSTGFIAIKDADGNVRKLMVQA
jgi:hypothetical protein